MSFEAFNQLVDILHIHVDELKSRQSTGGNDPIIPRMIVAMGLRYLGGEELKSIADMFGTSIGSANRVTNVFLDAVDRSVHQLLSINRLPTSYSDRVTVASE